MWRRVCVRVGRADRGPRRPAPAPAPHTQVFTILSPNLLQATDYWTVSGWPRGGTALAHCRQSWSPRAPPLLAAHTHAPLPPSAAPSAQIGRVLDASPAVRRGHRLLRPNIIKTIFISADLLALL